MAIPSELSLTCIFLQDMTVMTDFELDKLCRNHRVRHWIHWIVPCMVPHLVIHFIVDQAVCIAKRGMDECWQSRKVKEAITCHEGRGKERTQNMNGFVLTTCIGSKSLDFQSIYSAS